MNKRVLATLAILAAVAIAASVPSNVANAQGPQGGGSDSGPYFSDPEAADSHCGYTDETTAGPYFVSGAPETTNLNYQSAAGEPMTVSGVVYDGSTGQPIVNALVNVWHVDSTGAYWPAAQGEAANFDSSQLNLRGIVRTNDKGEYQFTTIKPAIYEGRRRHIHYYITADGYIPLFTQTYWKDEPVVSDTTDLNTEACRYLTFTTENGVTQAKFDIYLRPASATATPAAAPEPTVAATVEALPFTLFNMNTITREQVLSIPGTTNRMVREFEEYRPYVSIQQFRREIGKYVGDAQVAEWEKYIYVPIQVNDSDAETLKQIPGVTDQIARDLIAVRPYASNDAFLQKLASYLTASQVAYATNYLEAQ